MSFLLLSISSKDVIEMFDNKNILTQFVKKMLNIVKSQLLYSNFLLCGICETSLLFVCTVNCCCTFTFRALYPHITVLERES